MDAFVIVCPRDTNESMVGGWMPERSPMARSCPAPKHCEYGREMASNRLGSARNPTPVSEIQLLRPFQTAQLNQAGGKTNYVIAMGLLQHSPRRITKPYTAFCETKKSRALSNPLQKLQTLVARSRPGGPVPRFRSSWAWSVARSRWPGPGGPVPVPL